MPLLLDHHRLGDEVEQHRGPVADTCIQREIESAKMKEIVDLKNFKHSNNSRHTCVESHEMEHLPEMPGDTDHDHKDGQTQQRDTESWCSG